MTDKALLDAMKRLIDAAGHWSAHQTNMPCSEYQEGFCGADDGDVMIELVDAATMARAEVERVEQQDWNTIADNYNLFIRSQAAGLVTNYLSQASVAEALFPVTQAA